MKKLLLSSLLIGTATFVAGFFGSLNNLLPIDSSFPLEEVIFAATLMVIATLYVFTDRHYSSTDMIEQIKFKIKDQSIDFVETNNLTPDTSNKDSQSSIASGAQADLLKVAANEPSSTTPDKESSYKEDDISSSLRPEKNQINELLQ